MEGYIDFLSLENLTAVYINLSNLSESAPDI